MPRRQQSELLAASTTAESWCTLLADINCFIRRDQAAKALVGAMQLLQESDEHVPIILVNRDQFAAVSDSLIPHDGHAGLRYYSSAHEAVATIVGVFRLRALPFIDWEHFDHSRWQEVGEVIANHYKSLVIGSSQASEFRARICRERARVVSSLESRAKVPKGKRLPTIKRKRSDLSDADTTILAALNAWHRYEDEGHGSVGKHEAATTSNLAESSGVCEASVSRFFARMFPGTKKSKRFYDAACRKGDLVGLLLRWNKDGSTFECSYDDSKPAGSQRRAGRAPGSSNDYDG